MKLIPKKIILYMNIFRKITLFIAIFSLVFLVLRFSSVVPITVLQKNLSGISWLYSTIALIFSIISAFVIQNQWNRWMNLEIAIKGEIDALWELIIFTEQLPSSIGNKLIESIKGYLLAVSKEDWQEIENELYSKNIEIALRKIQRMIITISNREKEDREMLSSIFLEIISNRNNRLHYSTGGLPFLLYILILVSTFMVILLSLFIAVDNVVIDYMFTSSIAILAFLIITIIDDLNHPFRPGTWHISAKKHSKLLGKVNSL